VAKYMVIHNVGNELTFELAKPFAEAVKTQHTVDAYWINSFYLREKGKLYCEWDAKDVDSVRQVISQVAPDFAKDEIIEMEYRIDSEDFRK
jgi:hypothetical protein